MRTVPVFIAVFGAAMGLIAASTQLSLADVPLKGSFLANKECPAFQSFRKGTNPGGAKVESGHSYQLLAKNAPIATHYRVRIENATPPERWVSADCGFLQEENAGSQGSGSPGGTLTENQTQFVLSLGWEPGFCESHNTKSECANERSDEFDATHFTLHGLWPQPRKREYCDVPQEQIHADRRGNWQALPIVNLSKETQEHLVLVIRVRAHSWTAMNGFGTAPVMVATLRPTFAGLCHSSMRLIALPFNPFLRVTSVKSYPLAQSRMRLIRLSEQVQAIAFASLANETDLGS